MVGSLQAADETLDLYIIHVTRWTSSPSPIIQ